MNRIECWYLFLWQNVQRFTFIIELSLLIYTEDDLVTDQNICRDIDVLISNMY